MAKMKTGSAGVIFTGPDQIGRGGITRYIADHGTETDHAENAARLVTHGNAAEFAKRKDIVVNDMPRCIGKDPSSYWEP